MAPRHRKNDLKVTDRHLAVYLDSQHDKVKKGIYFEEVNAQQFKENRVNFKPSDEQPDWYKFEKLEPYKTFDELFQGDKTQEARKFLENIKQYLKQHDQEATPTAVQSIAFPYIKKAEYDVMIRAQSGCGKTLAYAIPIIYDIIKAKREAKCIEDKLEMYALIVVPAASLCHQGCKTFKDLSEGLDIKVYTSHGSFRVSDVELQQRKGINILISDPPHLAEYFLESADMSITRTDKWDLKFLRYLVLDGASKILGKTAKPYEETEYYQYIEPLAYELLVLEETALQEYRLIMTSAHPNIKYYSEMPIRPNGCLYIELGDRDFPDLCIEQRFILSENDPPIVKNKKLADLIRSLYSEYEKLHEGEPKKIPRIIVFVNEPNDVTIVADSLRSRYKSGEIGCATELSNSLNLMDIVNEFKKKSSVLLVTTDVLSSGMDFDDVPYVINYNLPPITFEAYETFADRIGRCGRLGNSGTAITFFDPSIDSFMATKFVEWSEKLPSFHVPEFISKCIVRRGFESKVADLDKAMDKYDKE